MRKRFQPALILAAFALGAVAANASSATVCIAFSHDLPPAVTRPADWEVLRLQVVTDPWPNSPVHKAIVLTGSDVLGTIYAIYQFSQQFFGRRSILLVDRLPAGSSGADHDSRRTR